jgi:hypothetical protein
MEEIKNTYKILGGKSEGTRPLERSRCRWQDDIKMDLRERVEECGSTGL